MFNTALQHFATLSLIYSMKKFMSSAENMYLEHLIMLTKIINEYIEKRRT